MTFYGSRGVWSHGSLAQQIEVAAGGRDVAGGDTFQSKARHVVRTAGVCADTREALASQRSCTDVGANTIAVDEQIADVGPLPDELRDSVDARVQTQRQTVT